MKHTLLVAIVSFTTFIAFATSSNADPSLTPQMRNALIAKEISETCKPGDTLRMIKYRNSLNALSDKELLFITQKVETQKPVALKPLPESSREKILAANEVLNGIADVRSSYKEAKEKDSKFFGGPIKGYLSHVLGKSMRDMFGLSKVNEFYSAVDSCYPGIRKVYFGDIGLSREDTEKLYAMLPTAQDDQNSLDSKLENIRAKCIAYLRAELEFMQKSGYDISLELSMTSDAVRISNPKGILAAFREHANSDK